MTGKQKSQAIKLFRDGLNFGQISKEINVTRGSVRDFLIKMGEAEPNYKEVLNLEDSISALNFNKNHNLEETAQKFGCSKQKISRSFLQHKLVDYSEKIRLSEDEIDLDRIINLLESGLSLTKISKTLNLDHHRISNILEKRGIRKKVKKYKRANKK